MLALGTLPLQVQLSLGPCRRGHDDGVEAGAAIGQHRLQPARCDPLDCQRQALARRRADLDRRPDAVDPIRARRQIREGRDVDAAWHAGGAQALSHELVLELRSRRHDLGAGIADTDVSLEPAFDDDVDPLVDRGRHHGAAALAVELDEVGAAADEADP